VKNEGENKKNLREFSFYLEATGCFSKILFGRLTEKVVSTYQPKTMAY